jgi:hypothetical protein
LFQHVENNARRLSRTVFCSQRITDFARPRKVTAVAWNAISGGLDLAPVLRGAGYHRVHSAFAHGRTHGDERMQVSKRPHRGKYVLRVNVFAIPKETA